MSTVQRAEPKLCEAVYPVEVIMHPDPLANLVREYRAESRRYNESSDDTDKFAFATYRRFYALPEVPAATTEAGVAEVLRIMLEDGDLADDFFKKLVLGALAYFESGPPAAAAPAPVPSDPILAAIEDRRRTKAASDAIWVVVGDMPYSAIPKTLDVEYGRAIAADNAALVKVATTVPTTLAGFFAQARYAHEVLREAQAPGGGETLGDWRPGGDDERRTLEEMFLTSMATAAVVMGCAPQAEADPVFATIAEWRQSWAAFWGASEVPAHVMSELCDRHGSAAAKALNTIPTTPEGLRAFCEFGAELTATQNAINNGGGLIDFYPGAPVNCTDAEELFMRTLAEAAKRLLPKAPCAG